jgi:hypothetical protein
MFNFERLYTPGPQLHTYRRGRPSKRTQMEAQAAENVVFIQGFILFIVPSKSHKGKGRASKNEPNENGTVPNGSEKEPKGIPNEPRAAQRKPKETQREPKRATGEAKGAKKEPSGGQKAEQAMCLARKQNPHGVKGSQNDLRRCERGGGNVNI